MDKKVKKMWVEALRSRKYKQGNGQLKYQNEYCCLGVLCDLYRKTTRKGKWNQSDDINVFEVNNEIQDYTLPRTVKNWAGLDSADPFIDSKQNISASMANDNGKKFYEIARMIERNL